MRTLARISNTLFDHCQNITAPKNVKLSVYSWLIGCIFKTFDWVLNLNIRVHTDHYCGYPECFFLTVFKQHSKHSGSIVGKSTKPFIFRFNNKNTD